MSDRWENAGLVEVLLPSGRRVRGKPPALVELARRGLIPRDLLDWAMNEADPAWLGEAEADPAMASRLQEYMDQLVVQFVKDVWVDDAWQPVTLDPALLDRLPEGERDALERLASHRNTAEQVSQVSAEWIAAVEAGVLDEFDSPEQMEVESGVDRLLPFRPGDDTDAPGDDSQGVGPDPVELPAAPGRGRRVPRGRGARNAAVGGADVGGVEALQDAAR